MMTTSLNSGNTVKHLCQNLRKILYITLKYMDMATQTFPVLMSVFSRKTCFMYVIDLINCPVNCHSTMQNFVLFYTMFDYIARVFTVQSLFSLF